MRKFGVAAKRMPTLELRDRAGHVISLVPRGLWIIGESRCPLSPLQWCRFALSLGAAR